MIQPSKSFLYNLIIINIDMMIKMMMMTMMMMTTMMMMMTMMKTMMMNKYIKIELIKLLIYNGKFIL